MFRKKKDRDRAPRRGLGKKEEQFLHVREFSRGKPNELSLNVLEQKAAAQDEKAKGRARRGFWRRERFTAQESVPSAPAEASQPRSKRRTAASPPADPGILGPDSQEEIAKRQRRRRLYRRASVAVVAIACAVALGVFGCWAYEEQVRLSTSVGVLKEACSLIEESDETTVAIDSFFQTPFGDDTVSQANALSEQIPDARETLESARVYAQKAAGELEGSQRDKEAAERTLNAIDARETLLDVSEERLQDDVAAKQAIDAMDEAWASLSEGNSLLTQAARVVSDTTEENVGTSTEYTTHARAAFAEARDAVEKAKELYPSADFDASLAYIDKRIEAADEALASNAAILIQDKQTAESRNDAYNEADQEAVEMAESLPDQFSQPVIDAYAANSEDLIASYDAARTDAASNDSFLREYLGTNA